jgi:hypothetical protein
MGEILREVTESDVLRRVRRPPRHEGEPQVFYGARTCWWTTSGDDLGTVPGTHGLPCDPRGGVLMQADDIEGFITAAARNPSHYGRHGIRAFYAAYHGCLVVSLDDPRPWCFATWAEYNDALDRFDARRSA